MKTTRGLFAVLLAISFLPWLVAGRLALSFGKETRTPVMKQIQGRGSDAIHDVLARKQYGSLLTDGDGGFLPLSVVIMHSRPSQNPDKIWFDLVKDLLLHGAKTDQPTVFHTPLQSAAFNNSAEMIDLLVAHGAKVDFPSCDGKTPLRLASESGHKEAVSALLSAGADANIRDKNGKTAIDLAKTEEVRRTLTAGKRTSDE